MSSPELRLPDQTESFIVISPQKAAVNANLYCFLLDTISEHANRYATQRVVESPERFIEAYERSRIGIEDIYFSLKLQQQIPGFYGEEAESFRKIASGLVVKITKRQNALEQNSNNITMSHRLLLAAKLQLRQRQMSAQQRVRLYEAIGYSQTEAALITKSLVKSLALSTATGLLFTAVTGTVVASSKIHPFLGSDVYSPENMLALGVSYVMHYGAAIKNASTNVELLRNEAVGTSPNIYATSLYFLLKKLAPEHESFQKAAIIAGSLAPTAVPEAIFLPVLFASPAGPSIVVGRNVLGSGLNLLQTKTNTFWGNRARKKNL